MCFLSQGQKIKKLRKQLGMSQLDFTDENISKSYICMIENGTRRLNKNVAEIIVNKMIARASQLKISMDLDQEYLIRDSREDARVFCMEKLNNSTEVESLDEILRIAKEYDLADIELQCYMAKGNKHYDNKQFQQAFIIYSNIINLYSKELDKKLYPFLYNRLGICKSKEYKFKEAGFHFDKAVECSALYDDKDTMKNVFFNKAMNCKKLKEIHEAIDYIEKYISLYDCIDEGYIYANSLKANCLYEIGEIDSAIGIYNSLLERAAEIKQTLLAYVYNSLGSLYLEINDYEKSWLYFNKSLEIREQLDRVNLPHTMVDKARLYFKQKLYKEAVRTLNRAIGILTEFKDKDYLIKAYNLYYDINCELKQSDEAEDYCMKIIDVLKGTDNYRERLNVYFKLLHIYIDQGEKEKALKYSTMIQKITDNYSGAIM